MRLLLCFVLSTLFVVPAIAQDEMDPPIDQSNIAFLIKELEVGDGARRDEAAKRLVGIGMAAIEPLYDGPAATADLRKQLRGKILAQRDARYAKQGLVVHEWGSLRMLANHKGATVGSQWTDASDLPKFVHVWEEMRQNVPMVIEKPIIYFYPPSDQPMQVNVMAQAREGMFTQYYPKPSMIQPMPMGDAIPPLSNGVVSWNNVQINPAAAKAMPKVDPAHPWWHIARDVDATAVTVNGEAEKFLFYRGVTKSSPAIHITGDEASGVYELHNASKNPIRHAIMMRVTDTGASYRLVRLLNPDDRVTVDFNETEKMTWTDAKPTEAHFRERLEWHGLFAKESTGLLKIWGKDFFQRPGIRLLYIMHPNEADAAIKLTINPKPAHVARALIVQVECETQAMRKRIRLLIDDLGDADFDKRQAAQAELQSLDRFAESLLREAMKDHPDAEVRLRVEEILNAMRRKN